MSHTIGRVTVALSRPGMMGGPPVRVPDLMTTHDIRIMPRSPDLLVRHNNDDADTGETNGAGQSRARVLEAGTDLAHIVLVRGNLVVKPALIGLIELRGREKLGQSRAAKAK
jgi:hypothetical protein